MRKMKRIFAVILLVVLFSTLTACNSKLSGTYFSERGTSGGEDSIQFSGNSFTREQYFNNTSENPDKYIQQGHEVTIFQSYYNLSFSYNLTRQGKYSISDNQIELVYSDGSVDVYGFSRTDNTIILTLLHSGYGIVYTKQ